VYCSRTVYPSTADGDAHSSNYDDAQHLLFGADENFCKTSGSGTEKGYGHLTGLPKVMSTRSAESGF
jgi:hypothetical protein